MYFTSSFSDVILTFWSSPSLSLGSLSEFSELSPALPPPAVFFPVGFFGGPSQPLPHHEKKNAPWRNSKRQHERNRPVRPMRRKRAVLHFGTPRKCQWILRPVAIWQFLTLSRVSVDTPSLNSHHGLADYY